MALRVWKIERVFKNQSQDSLQDEQEKLLTSSAYTVGRWPWQAD